MRKETRAWCSDVADLDVPVAASTTFPHLSFRAWGESRSAQNLLTDSLKEEDAEIAATDSLLVTRKKPPSLAKFCPRPPCSATQWAATAGTRRCVRQKLRLGPRAFQQAGTAPRTGKSTLGHYLQGARRRIPGEPPRSAHSRPRFLGRARGREQFASASWGVAGRSARRTLLLLARYRRQNQSRRCNSSR